MQLLLGFKTQVTLIDFVVGNEKNNETVTDHESTAWPSEYMQGRYASNSKTNVAVVSIRKIRISVLRWDILTVFSWYSSVYPGTYQDIT